MTQNGSQGLPRCDSGRDRPIFPGRSRLSHKGPSQELSGFCGGAQRRQRTQRSWFPCTSSDQENPLCHNAVLNSDSLH